MEKKINPNFRKNIESQLDYEFKDPLLLDQALTHKSYTYSSTVNEKQGHNERLEFLGDAVIGLSVGFWLMKKYPSIDEGSLSRMRANLVREESLSENALSLGIDKGLQLSKGEEKSGGTKKPRLLASAYEALIGALFLEAGYDRAFEFIAKICEEHSTKSNDFTEDQLSKDHKTKFQEKYQELFKAVPSYRVIREKGLDHNKTFYVEAYFEDKSLGCGKGKSKKQAQQEAARRGLEKLNEI